MSEKETPEKQAPKEVKVGKRYVMFGDGRIQRVDYDNGGEAIDVAVLENGILTYASEDTKRYHAPVAAFLNENSIKFDRYVVQGATTISEVRAGSTVTIPAPPPKNKRDGDKTPEYVEWFKEYYPEEFEKKYGVIGKGSVKKHKRIPHPEIVGRETTVEIEVPALLSTRKTHLTEKPIHASDDGYAEIPQEKEKI